MCVILQDAFSLLAYSNPWSSPLGWQLCPSRRETVCAALNSAILGIGVNYLQYFCHPFLLNTLPLYRRIAGLFVAPTAGELLGTLGRAAQPDGVLIDWRMRLCQHR